MSEVKLHFQSPYAVEPLTGALRAHCVAGLERHDDGVHTRVIPLPSGRAVVSVSWSDDCVVVNADAPESDSEVLEATVRRWLDLDADHTAIEEAFGSDELLAPLVAARPGLRVLGSVDGFETAVLTVLGQQVSLGAARTFGGRFVGAFGESVEGEFLAFPHPGAVAAQSPENIQKAVGLTTARAKTVHTLATAAANGLELTWDADPVKFRQELLALPGIGPWTADYLTVRILGDRDAFVPDDLVLKRALGVSSGKEAAALSERWRPWRAYALFHLWTKEAFL
ncbi:AlkA N-terminal domain-containing protein [Rhodococcus sp. IEGM 1409]|uniref:DNA-3-methyladenine glycosylase family protein n=1 Tax=Rhodococcus sp. IEGM 1409 TaxID=3047082 RepID=UPI0024B6E846|nr:AlkA N-terminal domain-containing protein [Rhodococcus sp. IEGM 1409]MDI9901534.1 AlkA N-terminal domain-containing protein [Rhodococcus sp. IEGM 1409]